MADDRKILVDDDWKAQARAEKERLAEQQSERPEAIPASGIVELINLIVMQAMAGLGLMAGPGGERIPPNFAAAKHFIDLLQVLDDKTKGNLTADEKKLLDQVLYEMRMHFVQRAGAAGGAGPGIGV
ncbi:MAG: DUF1844 domain-containing protein [Planctomycetes bacterium]|nr:DUF1844 domain-containing protein [Planctomycetota bacterium]